VHAIIAAYRQAAAAGTELRLVATSVLRILELVGVDQLILIYPTLQAALAAGE
jgi:anti-anti-sigma regulatory factor